MITSPIVAVVTPFDAKGAVDRGALRDYLALLSDAGVTTILVNGTTGEFFSMASRERGAVLELCREHWPGQIIAHIGSAAIGDTIDLLDHARSHTDYVAAIAPYFYACPPEEGVYAYFRQLLARSDLPLFLYNFPRHTQTDITPSVVSRLAAEFPLLHGLVTGNGGPVVELPLRITDAVQGEDLARAHQLQAHFDQWSDARRASPLTGIAFTKAALTARLPGFPPYVRPPLVTATDSQCQEIRSFLRRTMLPLLNPHL